MRVCCPQEISSHIQRWQVNLSRNYNDNFTSDCFWFTDLHPRDRMHHVVCMCGVILHREHKDSIKNDDFKELVNLNCAAVTAPKNQVCCREGKEICDSWWEACENQKMCGPLLRVKFPFKTHSVEQFWQLWTIWVRITAIITIIIAFHDSCTWKLLEILYW